MKLVQVHTLKVAKVGEEFIVTFKRYYGNKERQLTCHQHEVLTQNPLRIILYIPRDKQIPDMREYEGQYIVLVLDTTPASPLDTGE
jgi:hypothetical protein